MSAEAKTKSADGSFPRGGGSKTVPLNSRRLTAQILRSLAAGLDIPTSASNEELWQMIKGKLLEQEREPRDVQVVIMAAATEGTGASPERIMLQDEDGVFLEVESSPTMTAGGPGDGEHEENARSLEGGERADTLASVTHDPLAGVEEGGGSRSDTSELMAEREEYHTEMEELLESERSAAARVKEEKQAEIDKLRGEVREAKRRSKEVWRMNCEQLLLHDEKLAASAAEIAELKSKLSMVIGTLPTDPPRSVGPVVAGRTILLPPRVGHEAHSPSSLAARATASPSPRRGKAPPVDPFSGDSVETDLDDWLPTLERAASWNVWSDEEMLMQLAGHLRGRALQEWNLIPREEKSTYSDAVSPEWTQETVSWLARTLGMPYRTAQSRWLTMSVVWNDSSRLHMAGKV